MIDAKDLTDRLPDLRDKLRRTVGHDGAAAALIRVMPLFLGFLEHEDRLRKSTSPDAVERLGALRAAAATFSERIRDAEGEPIERIRGYIVNALTPRTAPASSFADDGLVRTAVATALALDVDENTGRVTDGRPARELVNSAAQQADTLVAIIDQILKPTGRPEEHAREVIASGVAEILANDGVVVSLTPNGAFDAALRDVLEALGSYGPDHRRLLKVGVEHVTLKQA